MEACSLTLPDFTEIDDLMLAPAREIGLMPGSLEMDSRHLRVIPSRDGVPMPLDKINEHTLPRFDLASITAGADTTVPQLVEMAGELLKGKKFYIQPAFSLCGMTNAAMKIPEIIQWQGMAMSMEWRFDRPSPEKIQNELEAPLRQIPPLSFLIGVLEEVPGLDLSQLVEGAFLDILKFVLPSSSSKNRNRATKIAFGTAIHLVGLKHDLEEREESYSQYIKKFHLFNKQRRMRKSLDEMREAIEDACTAFNLLVPAAKADIDPDVALANFKPRGYTEQAA